MTAAPHLIPIPGPAADLGTRLSDGLPVLNTARCILRAPVLADATAWITIMAADTEGHIGGPLDPDNAFKEFAATVGLWLLRGHGLWTVTDKAGTVLGFVLLGFEPGDKEPELGFLFCEDARGRGLAAEAATAARTYALEILCLPSLVSYIAPGNTASRRLAERLGARLEGTVGDHDDPEPAEIWRHAPGGSA
ncbi:MAG: GNAT family N-acetyltransferase [Pararhodobacter sp.]|nr:GNAT family N-acetyltransferase [Pararhodobacter sp.]